jgi:cell wall-associated NlpC family hydrolase
VESPRRTPSGSRRPLPRSSRRYAAFRYGTLPVGAVALAALLTIVLGLAPAGAQPSPPPPPDNAADAAAQLEQVQHEAEALTEQWHAAKDELTARETELETLRAAVEPARAAVAAAKANEEEFRKRVDALATSTFESGRLDQFGALLTSETPQEFLDKMSMLEILAADYKDALEELKAVVDETEQAQTEADAAVARAQAAAEEAAKAEQEIEKRKREAEMRIHEAEELLDRLTPEERRDRTGPDVEAPDIPITGTGVGVEALRAARTQLGKPYKWGAEGPGAYDCSGLTSWAFEQAGVTIPRSSSKQATIGRPVSWDELQPGDLVFYYTPVSHVGIYAGEGKMIDAPQTGDVVSYNTVSSSAFSGARRL